MAIYCEKCRTRIVEGSQCSTCGHVNPGVPTSSGTPEAVVTGDLVPPPPPTKASDPRATGRSKKGLFLGVAAGLVAIIAVIAFFATRRSENSSIVVDYSIEVFTSDYCDEFSMTGYDDIPYSEVIVIDGEGTVLGISTLDGGYDTDDSCVFSTSFEIRKSSTGIYRITAGNSNRGYINFRDADIRNGQLVAEATLGN